MLLSAKIDRGPVDSNAGVLLENDKDRQKERQRGNMLLSKFVYFLGLNEV